ncbi:Uncharacterised protein [uncultured archaeon]|nr:Uncharacterised protein [uncultured archaeon]
MGKKMPGKCRVCRYARRSASELRKAEQEMRLHSAIMKNMSEAVLLATVKGPNIV